MAGPGLDNAMRSLSLAGGGGVGVGVGGGGGGGGGGPSIVRYVSQVASTDRPPHLLHVAASPGPAQLNGRTASRADTR